MDWSDNSPLYQAVSRYFRRHPDVFHMPGHRFGEGMLPDFAENALCFDVTEIPGTDNLHQPEGPIALAQQLAAKAFGARNSFFLVNGSTVGIHAMILAACRPGDKLIIPRNFHQSVIGGLFLADAEPCYVLPEWVDSLGVPGGVDPQKISLALDRNPEAVGVLLTSPTYYGHCSDLRTIAEIVHGRGKVLLVDEAHGAHFAFSDKLPHTALECGADLCVQSLHKTLPVMTQGALLHVGNTVYARELEMRVRKVLDVLQTTSPSYPIMVSMDLARAYLESCGQSVVEKLLERCNSFKRRLSGLGFFVCQCGDVSGQGGVFETDPLRIVINVLDVGLTGYKAEDILRKRWNIQVEMSDYGNIVCIPGLADGEDKFNRLFVALKSISEESRPESSGVDADSRLRHGLKGSSFIYGDRIYGNGGRKVYEGMKTPIPRFSIPQQQLSPREALLSESCLVPLREAEGRVSCARVTPYPPGIPVICPGEVYSGEIIQLIEYLRREGGRIIGIDEDGMVSVLK